MKTLSAPALAALTLSLALSACIVVVDSDGTLHHRIHDHDGNHESIRGSGVSATESRAIEAFDRVVVEGGSADVRIRCGEAPALSVTGDDNLLPYVVTEVRDGALVIGWKPGSYSPKCDLRVTVDGPSVGSLSIRGSSDVRLTGATGDRLEVEILGSGDARVEGKVDRLRARISGSGDLHLNDLEAREANLAIAGSGDAEVWAAESLDVSIAGSGDVRYRGSPVVTKSIAGSGSVTGR